MVKKLTILLIVSFMLFGSGCSTYNSIVPNWATIGSTSNTDGNKSETRWWNPFSWF